MNEAVVNQNSSRLQARAQELEEAANSAAAYQPLLLAV